jgi:hypothetical protein
VPDLCATTAAGLARRLSDTQWAAVETGLGDVHATALAMLGARAPARATAPRESVTIDLDTTDVEVYGRHKRGVAYNHQGRRVGRPHVATWADTATVLAADLLAGNEDPRRDAPALLRRALAALPASARVGRVRLRADAGYFAGQLARAALFTGIEFATGARRIAPLWRLLDGLGEDDWTDAIDMPAAQVGCQVTCGCSAVEGSSGGRCRGRCRGRRLAGAGRPTRGRSARLDTRHQPDPLRPGAVALTPWPLPARRVGRHPSRVRTPRR